MDEAWWLEHIFNKSLWAKYKPGALHAFDLPPLAALGLMTRIFSNCHTLFDPLTDTQIAEGITFLSASGESDWMSHIYDPSIDQKARFDCIRSIEALYRDCFRVRCPMNQVNQSSDLNTIDSVCFMFWDRFPSAGSDETTQAAVDSELIEVMGKALQIEHDTCQTSALHGLGHWEIADEKRVHTIIDDWLARHPHLSASIRKYAQDAREGNVM